MEEIKMLDVGILACIAGFAWGLGGGIYEMFATFVRTVVRGR